MSAQKRIEQSIAAQKAMAVVSMEDRNVTTEAGFPALVIQVAGGRGYLLAKRIQDIVLSALALLVLSPVLAVIALLIVLDDPSAGPFFSQIRYGKDGRLFRFYKFRTMCADAETQQEVLQKYNEMQGPTFKIKEDPRITRFGKILRRTSLDELPQLINVLKGEMSLVGPRPPLPNEVAEYTPYQRQRLLVQPGLTCFWQVHPDRYNLPFGKWVELDLQYIQERSFWWDWKIIFLTVRCILRGEGE